MLQSSLGSNCSWVQVLSELRLVTFLAWPAMLRKVYFPEAAMPKVQRHLVV